MRFPRLAALALGGCLLLGTATLMGAPAASAAVSAMPCAPTATIVARGGHGYLMWAGLETSGVLTRFNGSTLTRGQHFYQLQGEVIRVSFGGDSIVLANNAVFALGCSGLAVGQRAVMPSLRMLQGTAVVHTTHAVEGSIMTEEGLFGQVPYSAASTYTLVRQPRQHAALTMLQKIYWYLDLVNQPVGSTAVRTLTGVLENVTPYVGPGPGHCRHVHSATLTTLSAFGRGTAVYHY